MQVEIEKVKQFVKWYEETARPFLLKTADEKVADFDKDAALDWGSFFFKAPPKA